MKSKQKVIGILAFQGGVIEHQKMVHSCGCSSFLVRNIQDLQKVDALIIPGGESTTMGLFLETTGLKIAIQKRVLQKINPMPIWGTCAGAILLAQTIESHIIPPHLGLMDITIERNAYGCQIDSFYAEIPVPILKIKQLKTAFIRAPIIQKVGSKVQILASYQGKPVLVQQGKMLASTFHPELRGEDRIHRYFIGLI